MNSFNNGMRGIEKKDWDPKTYIYMDLLTINDRSIEWQKTHSGNFINQLCQWSQQAGFWVYVWILRLPFQYLDRFHISVVPLVRLLTDKQHSPSLLSFILSFFLNEGTGITRTRPTLIKIRLISENIVGSNERCSLIKKTFIRYLNLNILKKKILILSYQLSLLLIKEYSEK